jgi:prepilin-type N-terminal cleavage/methylation domain-containing protein
MTLIELLVALTITGLVLGAGYAAFAAIADRKQIIEESTDEAVRAASVRATLTDWLAGARLDIQSSQEVFRGLDGVSDELPDDQLTFLTAARTPLGERETVVGLFIDRDEATPERGLVAELSDRRRSAVRRLELLPAASSLDLHYLSGMLGNRRWLPSWISSSVMPVGIQATVGAAPPDTLPPLFRLPIVVSFANGR